jgi:triosephosphate isomerase
VWAISTFGGELAKPDDVQKSIAFIRMQIAELYGRKTANEIRVLYGGSVDDQIAKGYLAVEGCNGALVGGASLNHHKFAGIVEAAHALSRETHQTKGQ